MTRLILATISTVLVLMLPCAASAQVAAGAIDHGSPELLDFDDMQYPPLARIARVAGVVVVRATLDDRGRVSDTVSLSGPKMLDASALANAKWWKFKAGTGKEVILVYSFEIIGTCTHGTPTILSISHPYNFVRVITCAEWQAP